MLLSLGPSKNGEIFLDRRTFIEEFWRYVKEGYGNGQLFP
jgi:hypothetical protein